ncbi:HEAT repeat domain-containing protein [Bythopirellula polymerisocia]|uniref:HEAT repeat protein n=1 Tax=Bythopirellula polymerisocia TaxID=2528003 RepID=A0A5C6CAA0_9BACT|nr:HEAT repeat domain-containing protein [Bythopirellula polymerisocia]TWU20324.1 hypothetical protein Pla144_49710 [Bythopirellula polymerisocia]
MVVPLSSLITSLSSDQASERQVAAGQLLQLGPAARPAVVALVEAADSDDETREIVTAVLEDLGPPDEEMTLPLADILQRTTLDSPYWAATLLGRLEAAAAPAAKALITAAEEHPQGAVRQRAVWALGKIGPPATEALETLEEILAEDDPRLVSLAKNAIESIRG